MRTPLWNHRTWVKKRVTRDLIALSFFFWKKKTLRKMVECSTVVMRAVDSGEPSMDGYGYLYSPNFWLGESRG